MHFALVVREEARSTADISGSRASPTSRLTLAATDVYEDRRSMAGYAHRGQAFSRSRTARVSAVPDANLTEVDHGMCPAPCRPEGARPSGIIELMSDGLSTGEWDQFIGLLQRFAENDLDQHEAWRLDTRYGPAFVRVTRELPQDESPGVFQPVGMPPIYSTGRSAHVSGLDRVASCEDVQRVIAEMRADLCAAGAREWENRPWNASSRHSKASCTVSLATSPIMARAYQPSPTGRCLRRSLWQRPGTSSRRWLSPSSPLCRPEFPRRARYDPSRHRSATSKVPGRHAWIVLTATVQGGTVTDRRFRAQSSLSAEAHG